MIHLKSSAVKGKQSERIALRRDKTHIEYELRLKHHSGDRQICPEWIPPVAYDWFFACLFNLPFVFICLMEVDTELAFDGDESHRTK